MSTPNTQPTHAAVAPAQDFIHLAADGTVVDADSEAVVVIQDNRTQLQWGAYLLDKGKKADADNRLKAASACNLLGGTDWQACSVAEFDTVKDITRHAPAVHPVFHRWGQFAWIWARDPVADPDLASDCAWFVGLHLGSSGIGSRDYPGCALVCRPVPGVVSSPRQS